MHDQAWSLSVPWKHICFAYHCCSSLSIATVQSPTTLPDVLVHPALCDPWPPQMQDTSTTSKAPLAWPVVTHHSSSSSNHHSSSSRWQAAAALAGQEELQAAAHPTLCMG
jgi:hypothetical protein